MCLGFILVEEDSVTENKSNKGKAAAEKPSAAADAATATTTAAKATKAKATPAKKKKSVGFWIGLTTGVVAVGLVGSVWVYGSFVFPAIQRADLDKKDVAACQLFYEGLSASKDDLKDAMQKVLVKVDDAITLYDPTFSDQDPQFGKVYEAMLRIADVGISGLSFPELAAENFDREITRTEEICFATLQADHAKKVKEESNK